MSSIIMPSTIRLALLALGTAAFLAGPAGAETVNMKADLKASEEVPPNPSKGTGSATMTYDTATKRLTWKGSYKDLTGPATAAHFHGAAEPGKNAGVMIPIAPNASPFEGSATLTDEQAAALTSGRLYINIHTEANKGGEIRGQVVK